MKEPLISIIVPIYNAEKYLRKCLDSILAQTYPNWEAICIDDGSSDNSSEILKEYAKKDLRILAIPQKARGGVSAARNAGLDAAQGDYVYFMDADDYVSPYFFELAKQLIVREEPDCICCDYAETRDYGFAFSRPQHPTLTRIDCPFDSFLTYRGLFSHNLWTKMFRRKCIGALRFVPEIIYGEDLYFNILAFHNLKTAVCIDEKLYCNVKHEGSITTSAFSEQKAWGFLLICRKLYEQFGREPFFARLRQNISNLNLKFVMKKTQQNNIRSERICREICQLKKLGAVSGHRLPLKMRLELWLICRKYAK